MVILQTTSEGDAMGREQKSLLVRAKFIKQPHVNKHDNLSSKHDSLLHKVILKASLKKI